MPSLASVRPAPLGDRGAMRRAAVTHALIGVLPLLLTLDVIHYTFQHGHIQAFDFHYEFWPAAERVLHGLSPYSQSWMNIHASIAFPYPALTAVAFVPFTLLNHALADWVFTGLSIAAALLTLRVLAVRDWRVYGLLLIWWPVVIAWQVANLTLLLGLGIAYLWRNRNNPVLVGVAIAVLISLKPFVWPLGLWLLATRRYRAAGYGAAAGVLVNVAAWAIVGVNQLHAYGQVLSATNSFEARRSYSLVGLVTQLGGGHTLAYAAFAVVAAAALLACVIVGRRGDDRGALLLCIAACLLASPVLWSHYFALLIVSLAIYRPRLDRLWLAPLVMVACPAGGPAVWQIIVALATCSLVVGSLLRGSARPKAPAGAGERDQPLGNLDLGGVFRATYNPETP